MRKSIILAIPEHVGFPLAFKKNFESEGFNVSLITVPASEHFKYKNLFQRLQNLFRKTFLGDKDFKRELFVKNNKERLTEQLKSIEHTDYALFIRPDLFPLEIVQLVKKKCGMLVGYQWDGLDRYPAIYQYLHLMDRFFVFDATDLKSDTTLPTTNFYFDFLSTSIPSGNNTLYYIGSYLDGRIDIVKDVDNKLKGLNVNRNIKIATNNERIIQLVQANGLTPISTLVPYEENLTDVMNAHILLDIQNPIHNGLSFRIFEGIGYDKKVITTNPNVIKYDFYRPENILIWNEQSLAELKQFIDMPYQVLPEDIKQKYSFSNWAAYMLDLPHHMPINLPN
ncbi:hypothetical protein [Sphingobacterium sp. SGR-19]|uniref:hypothetical protein n=1 Tax=Sphingobacterium sp. SGR-19 TaxID=2710886 RepID=UPI0013EB06D9|nr:hypothetical protein [Sphingobacterium sp. SGR-19]NGM64782.1 hypothetical protein [Sphingobacterium sp. SGR-19]